MVLLTLPAQIDSLKDCCAFVRAGAEASNLAPQDMEKLDLVMEELFVNIARYAYAPEYGEVEVGYTAEAPGRLAVQLSDSGREFNPLASDPPDFSRGLADRPLGGMGIYLVKIIADSIRYQRSGGRNTLSFTFLGETRR
jgi:anti-sigma regulatory factor (Ser/Thr protein kinase)